jgi:hypothetical protein
MYKQIINWKTPLLYCNCESCFVSHVAPCHVYAKLKQGNYAKHCAIYAILWYTIQCLYSWNYYLYSNSCPSEEIHYCLQLEELECADYYMTLNGVATKCVFHSDANICTYDEQSCILPSEYRELDTIIFLTTSMMYTCLCLLHYSLRKEIQIKKEIEYDATCCLATTCCSTCGLAQEYRELELQNTNNN